MNKFLKFLSLILIFPFVLSIFACGETPPPDDDGSGVVHVTEVVLNKDFLLIQKGDSVQLVVTVKPDNATNKNVKWSVADQSVATVNNGFVSFPKYENKIAIIKELKSIDK